MRRSDVVAVRYLEDFNMKYGKERRMKMQIGMNILLLIVGFVALIEGADIFVEGSASVAKRLKVPGVIIGLTIVAMGTSAPELAVSTSAALAGSNGIAISNVVGSNIFNLLVVLGICALMKPLPVGDELKKRDYPISIVCTLVVFILSGNLILTGKCTNMKNMNADAGTLFHWNGIILIVLFLIYIAITIQLARKNRIEEEETKVLSPLKCVVFIVGGIIAIIVGGQMVVNGAKGIATFFGMSETLIGLTIVAIGTSLPELVTSVVASGKGENGMAIGNVVGSNIFNLLFILGVSTSISSISISVSSFVDLGILLGVTLIAYAFVVTGKTINRIEGGIMVFLYGLYMLYAIMR